MKERSRERIVVGFSLATYDECHWLSRRSVLLDSGYFAVPEGRPSPFYLPAMRTNPYVGIFRHAPPAFTDRRRLRSFDNATELRKDHRTVGIVVLQATDSSSCDDRTQGACGIGGRLPGGAQDERFRTSVDPKVYPPMTWLDEKISDSVAFATSTSTSIVGGGGSLPPAFRAVRQLQRNWNSHFSLLALTLRLPSLFRGLLLLGDINDGNNMEWKDKHSHFFGEEEEYSDYEDDSSTKSSSSCCKRSNPSSSVVEDYTIGVEALLDLLDSCASYDAAERMDYVITQTDIARMARNASKHLDVASILSLPTITYRSPPPTTVTIRTEAELLPVAEDMDSTGSEAFQDGMWSWLMIPRDAPAEASHTADRLETHEGDGAGYDEQSDPQDETFDHHDQDCCVICLENFSDGDKLRVLPCSHLFHTGCIDHWLLGTYSDYDCVTSGCPMCKKRATTIADEVISPDGSVPSWAFARLGGALAKESYHQSRQGLISTKEDVSLPSSVSSSV